MFEEQDYLLRQIRQLAQAIGRIFFHREDVRYSLPSGDQAPSDTDLWYRKVLDLMNAGRVNEAENLLFERLNPANRQALTAALDFYQRLSDMDEASLIAAGFSREEIRDGLRDAANLYGIDL